MVALSLVQSTNAALVASQPLVAVFVGGTSGIGTYSIKSLATTHGTEGRGLRAYIIGRNRKSAEAIIADCQKVCPNGEFHFISVRDLALMRDVDIACVDLAKFEEKNAKKAGDTARIDILVMTQAIFKPWDPRKGTFFYCFFLEYQTDTIPETTEGLDVRTP